MRKIERKLSADFMSIFTLCCIVIGVLFAIWTFTGKWAWLHQPYNSYILQAQAWKSGRLDIAQNYSHLEIALFEGKYYISFPPFPSYVMFPFVLLGFKDIDGIIALISAVMGAVYAFKIFRHCNMSENRSFLFTLLLTVGSNWLFTAQIAWVWFIAQNMAFTLSVMAIYYALKGKCALSLALWACAVGCRPFHSLYIPVILYLLYICINKETGLSKITDIIKLKWKCVIPMLIIALSYMILNYARFNNPFEFGHNYLPEHTESVYGQFSAVYVVDNLKTLFRLPKISFTGAWEYQAFNGTNIFIISPIFTAYVAYTAYLFISKNPNRQLVLLIFTCVLLQLVAIAAHNTMGGSQFGHRYTNDCLPLIFLSIALSMPENEKYDKLNIILLGLGICVNAIGSAMYYIR